MRQIIRPAYLTILLAASLQLVSCGGSQEPASSFRAPAFAAASTQPTAAHAVHYNSLQRIYVAFFGRPADPAGMDFYARVLQGAQAPTSIVELAKAYYTNPDVRALIDSFGTSQESRDLYAGDDGQFIEAVYQNLFGRPADAAGKAYWIGVLQAGAVTRANAAVTIMAGALGTDVAIIDNKIAMAERFVSTLDTPLEVSAYSGNEANVVVRAMLRNVSLSTDPMAFQDTIDITAAELLASLSARAPVASQSDTEIRLANAHVVVTLDRATGTIASIVDPSSGLELVSARDGAYRALWGINLGAPGNPLPWADNHSSGKPDITVNNSAGESSVLMVWHGLNFDTGVRIPGATVTVKVSLGASDPLSRWSFEAHGLGGIKPVKLQFPLIGGVGQLGADASDNRLAVPEQDGRLISNPIGSRSNYGGIYPSTYMTMQFAAYYNGKAGFYVGTRDTGGQTKSIQWYSPPAPANSAIWQVTHMFPDEPVDDLVLPYEAVVGTFQGDWMEAARLYKSWAQNQDWTREASRKTLPAWLQETPNSTYYCLEPCGRTTSSSNYQLFLDSQAQNEALLGGKTLTILWGWEKNGVWFYGDYFPPAGGWTAFDQMVSTMHQRNHYLQLFISGVYLDLDTPLAQSGVANSGFATDAAGAPITSVMHIGGVAHTWQFMNPASAIWQEQLASSVATLAEHKIDAVQFDNWPFFEAPDDYSAGHPKGRGGNWQWQAWKTAMTRAQAAGRAVRPSMAFASEGVHELAIPFIDFYNDRDVMAETMDYSKSGTVIPLFSYVYKPYIQPQADYWGAMYGANPDSYHRLGLARALNWGAMPKLPNNPWLSDAKFSASMMKYYSAIARARTDHSRFLVHGAMLAPAAIQSPLTPVEIVGDGAAVAGYSGQAASIQASAWRAPTGEIGIVMTNIGPVPSSFTVPVRLATWNLVPGRSYAVSITSGATTKPLGSVSSSSNFSVTLQPLEIAVISITPN